MLETKQLLRASVARLAVATQRSGGVVFSTTATLAAPAGISSADSAMIQQAGRAAKGEIRPGLLQIDAINEHVFRVRYAEGAAIPDNDTPMLLPAAKGNVKARVGQKGSRVTLSTRYLELSVDLETARMEVRDHGRRLLCGIGGPEKNYFNQWDACNTGICRAFLGDQPVAVECFDLSPDEAVYGLGEKFTRLNRVGQTVDQDLKDAVGVMTPRSYKAIPFHLSTRGYGVFFNHSSRMTYWVGSRSSDTVQVALEDDFLDYYIITGSIREILARYQDLTGHGVMPPDWTFGYWQSKISYTSADETLDIARKMREHRVPFDVIHLDTHWFKKDWYCDLQFDAQRFPDVAGWYRALRELGVKVSLWQLPYIPEGSVLFDELKAVDGFVKDAAGAIYHCGICFTPEFKGVVGVVDYSNPAAVRVHQAHLRRLLEAGASVIKADFGEAAPATGVYHDGTPGHRMHNLYPLLYNKALFEVTKAVKGDGVIWARSAWAGSQRYPLHWGGDNSPNFANLIPQLEGGLSLGLSGFSFWSQDIGGFLGNTGGDLLVRWMQIGMFCSHSRIHGLGDRELYKFDDRTFRLCRDYIRLRYRMMPYILGSARRAVQESLPLMRALVVDFQDDPTVWNIGDQFLFGEGLMVCPVFTEDGRRRVYLPKGVWTDWWTHKRLEGGRWLEIQAPISRLPLYVREGAVIPMGPVMNFTGEKKVKRLDLVIAPFEKSGRTVFAVPVNDEVVRIAYEARRGRHTVTTSRTVVDLTIKALSPTKISVRISKD